MKVQTILQDVVAQMIRGIFGERRARRGLGRSGLPIRLDALEPRTLLSDLTISGGFDASALIHDNTIDNNVVYTPVVNNDTITVRNNTGSGMLEIIEGAWTTQFPLNWIGGLTIDASVNNETIIVDQTGNNGNVVLAGGLHVQGSGNLALTVSGGSMEFDSNLDLDSLTIDSGASVTFAANATVGSLVADYSSILVHNSAFVNANTLTITGNSGVTVDGSVLWVNDSTVIDGDGVTLQINYSGQFWGGDTMTLAGTSVTIAGDGQFAAAAITAAWGVNVDLMPGIIAATLGSTASPGAVLDLAGTSLMDLSQANQVTIWTEVYVMSCSTGCYYINSCVNLSAYMTFACSAPTQAVILKADAGQSIESGTGLAVLAFNYMDNLTLWSGFYESNSWEVNGGLIAIV